MGAFLDGEWESICKVFSVDESPDLSASILEYFSPASHKDDNLTYANPTSSTYENNPILPQVHINSFSSSSGWISKSPHNFLDSKSHTKSDSCATDFFASTDIISCIDFSVVNWDIDGSVVLSFPPETQTNTTSSDNAVNSENNSHNSIDMSSPNTELTLKRKREGSVHDNEEEKMSLMETPKKKAQKSTPKAKRKVQQISASADEITSTENTTENNEIADSNSDDSNPSVSEEINETEDSTSIMTVSTTLIGKKRASRGAATDPQSLYARKRRMRINERLRILQNLVPNGTKVDISTMLEEAFHYVKFLQLQIRLLSSDDLWMYAPLAYNGFDVGAYRRMPCFLGL